MTISETTEPVVLERAEHGVSRNDISASCLKVLYRLDRKGYKGYMVGGSVRDLMLGREPKDFDVSTDAKPKEMKRLFRNSRIIGRRFRLVHVYFKDGIVEVATFRRDPDPEAQDSADGELLITDDNVFGTPREDAFRRDFTVNALFYDISDFSVIDYVGGVDDLRRGQIRAIGDPEVRFREDPVRMMRACELAGRLDFSVEEGTAEGIREQRHEIEKASTARVTEEVCQLLRCGSAAEAMRWMLDLGLLEILLPEAYTVVAADEGEPEQLGGVVAELDAMVREGRDVPEPVLFGALLLPNVIQRRMDIEAIDRRPLERDALEEMVDEVVSGFFQRFQISAQRAAKVEKAILALHRLGEPDWSSGEKERFTSRSYFPDALLLCELMVRATGAGRELLDEWREVERKASHGPRGGRRRKSRRGPRRRGRRRGRRGGGGGG